MINAFKYTRASLLPYNISHIPLCIVTIIYIYHLSFQS